MGPRRALALLYQIEMSVLGMANSVIGIAIAPRTVKANILSTSRGSSKAAQPGIIAIWVFDAKEGVEIPTKILDPGRHSNMEMKDH